MINNNTNHTKKKNNTNQARVVAIQRQLHRANEHQLHNNSHEVERVGEATQGLPRRMGKKFVDETWEREKERRGRNVEAIRKKELD